MHNVPVSIKVYIRQLMKAKYIYFLYNTKILIVISFPFHACDMFSVSAIPFFGAIYHRNYGFVGMIDAVFPLCGRHLRTCSTHGSGRRVFAAPFM